MHIDISAQIYYNKHVRQGQQCPFKKEVRKMENGMTNTEFRVLLEMLAQLVESKATTIPEAVSLIRQFKPE